MVQVIGTGSILAVSPSRFLPQIWIASCEQEEAHNDVIGPFVILQHKTPCMTYPSLSFCIRYHAIPLAEQHEKDPGMDSGKIPNTTSLVTMHLHHSRLHMSLRRRFLRHVGLVENVPEYDEYHECHINRHGDPHRQPLMESLIVVTQNKYP